MNDAVGGHHGVSGTQAGATPVGFGAGMVASAFALNGQSYVQIANAVDLQITNAITIEAWINATTLGGRIVDKVQVGTGNGYLLDTFNNRLRLILNPGAAFITSPAASLPVLTFTHVAATWDGATATLYVNGSAVYSQAVGGTIPTNTFDLRLGADTNGQNRFNGTIDEVGLYNRALSSAEILAIYNAGSNGKCLCSDSDSDTFCDSSDPCTGFPNIDGDGDGICDSNDLCPLDAANDIDNDGRCANLDNCPTVSNPSQSDIDSDGLGDECDPDKDGDGLPNAGDNCPFDSNPTQADFDGDGIGDACDGDRDADGVVDQIDACVPTPLGEVVNAQGCSISDLVPCQPPGNPWPNHGAYVAAVVAKAREFRQMGLITGQQFGAIVSAAANAACP